LSLINPLGCSRFISVLVFNASNKAASLASGVLLAAFAFLAETGRV
jgi:hypothetical protein